MALRLSCCWCTSQTPSAPPALPLPPLGNNPPRRRSSSRSGSRTGPRKAHSPLLAAPCAVFRGDSVRRFGHAHIPRSSLATAPPVDPRLWSRLGIGEKPSSPRHGRTLLPAKPDRHTYGLAGPANTPEPPLSGLALPSHATPLTPAVPRWRRYSLRLEIPIPAVRRSCASARTP